MNEYENLDEWADALLDQHRSDPVPDREPHWLTKDMPRVGAFMEAAQAIGVILLCLIAFALIGVAFNSG